MFAQHVTLAAPITAPARRARAQARQMPEQAGFVAGTWVETPRGARRVEDLTLGDCIVTADGATTVLRARHKRRCTMAEMIRFVPDGAHDALYLPPRQRIMFRDWRTDILFGGASLVEAGDLVDGVAITRVYLRDAALFDIHCARPCLIRVNGRDVQLDASADTRADTLGRAGLRLVH